MNRTGTRGRVLHRLACAGAAVLIAALGLLVSDADAYAPRIEQGLAWLQGQIGGDGSLSAETGSIATVGQARTETLDALLRLNARDERLVSAVQGSADASTEQVARRILTLSAAGKSVLSQLTLLKSAQNTDGGFGASQGYRSNALDTAWALLALSVEAPSETTSRAFVHLLAAQNSDGGYAAPTGVSRVYVTSYVLLALERYRSSYAVGQASANALAWLQAQQVNGAYADSLHNALASMAIGQASSDTGRYVHALSALQSAQQPDGSWQQDPYVTSLALRALQALGTIEGPPPPPPATTGAVTGTLVDGTTQAPLTGVQVTLGTLTTTTDAIGHFEFLEVPPGTYTLTIHAPGYAPGGGSVTVAAGSTFDFGTLPIAPESTTAILHGTITNAAGQGLGGATLTITRDGQTIAQTITAGDGTFNLPQLAPGPIVITVTLSGYQPISVASTLSPGSSFTFSPTLVPVDDTEPAPTSATLTGIVLDAHEDQPIAGVTIQVGTQQVVTGTDGRFSLQGLSQGSFTGTASANGYETLGFSGTLVLGSNQAGTLRLVPIAQAVTLQGVVRDASTGQSIAGAQILVQGTNLAATTAADGSYTLSGIAEMSFTVYVEAAGYFGDTRRIEVPSFGRYTVNVALGRNGSTGVTLDVATALATYDPFREVKISGVVRNGTSQVKNLAFTASILDPQRRLLAEFPAVPFLERTTAPTTFTVPANGSLDLKTEWYNLESPAGQYTVVIRGRDASSVLVAEGSAIFTIASARAIGGSIQLDPPIVQAGANTPVSVTAQLANMGNLPLPAGPLNLEFILESPDPSLPQVIPSTARADWDGAPLNKPVGSAFDAAGNLYVINAGDRKILKRTPGGAVSLVATLSMTPDEIDIDSNGNLYVLGLLRNKLVRVAPITGVETTINTGIATNMDSMALDSQDNLYVYGQTGGILMRIAPNGTQTPLIRAGLSSPEDGVEGADGYLYVTNSGNDTLGRVDAQGRVTSWVTSGLDQPQGIALGPDGDFYVANYGANTVSRVTPEGQVSVFASGLSGPYFLAFDPIGNLLVTNSLNDTVSRVTPAGAVSTFAQNATHLPQGATYDASGALFIVNEGSNSVTKVGTDGLVTTVATGTGTNSRDIEAAANGDLYVTNVGVVHRISGTTRTTFASGLSSLGGLAIDPSGSIYVTEANPVRVTRIAAGGVKETVVKSFLTSPGAAAVDAAGNTYVVNSSSLALLPPSGMGDLLLSSTSSIGTINGAARAPMGGVVLLANGNKVVHVAQDGTTTTLSTLTSTMAGIATDPSGTVYVRDSTSKIYKLNASWQAVLFVTMASGPRGMSFALDGTMYVSLANGAVSKVTTAGVVQAFVTGLTSPTGVHAHSDGNVYVITNSGTRLTKVTSAGVATSLVTGLTVANTVVPADGDLLITESTLLRRVSTSGQTIERIAQMSSLKDIEWVNGRLLIVDSGLSRILSLVPGGNPLVHASTSADYLAANGANVLASSGNLIKEVQPDGTITTFYTGSQTLTGVAASADGAIAVVSRVASELTLLNQAKQVTATYAGIFAPTGIAVAPDGKVYVGQSSGMIVQIDPEGGQSRIFSNLAAVRALHRRPDGTFLAAHTTGAAIVQPNGTWQTYSISQTSALNALVEFNGGLYGLMIADAVDEFVSGKWEPFALGMDGACEIAVEAMDVLAALCQFRGITRFIDGRLVRVVGSLGSQEAFEPLAAGGYIIANASNGALDEITHISSTGVTTVWGGDMLLDGTSPGDLTAAPDGSVLIASSLTDAIIRITPGLPAPVVAAGTVMATRTVEVPPVPVSGAATSLDFGQWTPTVAGDYRVRIHSESLQGQLVTFLHVGPHARADMVASRTSAGPGDVPVTVQMNVAGADFTSISRADTASLTAVATVPAPKAIGADAAGNIWYIEGTALKRRSPTGTTSTVYNGTLTTFGLIPVDSQQNVYVGVTPNQIVKVTPAGVASVFAALPNYSVEALAIDSLDRLYVSADLISGQQGGYSRIFVVGTDGVAQLMATPDFSHIYALATDGADNVYALHQGVLHRIAKDGSTHVALSDFIIEDSSEGIPIAGDCADNLILGLYAWPKIQLNPTEETSLIHYIGRTQGAGAIINGLTTTPRLYDMDGVIFDRFNSRLVVFADGQWDNPDVPNTIYTLPITCGAINTELNLVIPADQAATGFAPPPTSTITLPDRATQYVWDLRDVVSSGLSISYDTVLRGLQIGESQATAREAFLTFSNTFAANEVRVPIRVPSVEGRGLIDLALATDRATYPANTEVLSTLDLDNLSEGPLTGNVTVLLLDASGVVVATLVNEPSVLDALGRTTLTPALNTGSLRPGNYTLAATFVDETGSLQDSASAAITISSTAVSNEVTSVTSTSYRQYSPDALVDVLARLQSTAVNYSQQQLLSTLTVAGPAGQVIFTGYDTTRELSPGLSIDQHFNVQLAQAPLGTYTATLVVTDPLSRIVSTSSTTFEVIESLSGALGGSVTASPRRVEIGMPVSCVDTVSNQRGYAFGAVSLRQTLLRLPEGTVLDSTAFDAALAAQSSTQFTRSIPTTGFAAGDYACGLELLDGGTWRSLGHAAFVVAPAPARIEGTTAAEFPELIRGGVQSCADTLANTGGSTAQNLLVRQTVLGAADQVVREQQQSVNLAPGAQQVLTRQFGTAEFTAGTYACAVEVREGTTWRHLSRASFEVKPVPAQVSGVTQVAQSQLERGGVQVCTDTLSNSGDVAAENALIRRTLSLVDGATVETLEQSLTLAGGASQSLSRDIDTTNLTAGDYACAVEIREGEAWKALGRAVFTVKPVPAKVVGNISAASAEVEYGSSQTCTDTLDNTGDLTASGIVIRRSLVDASGTSVRSDEQTLDIASHTPQTLTRTLDLAGLSAGTYSCVLEQQVQGGWTELGRAGFAIKPAPAKVEGSVSVAQSEVQRGTAQSCTDVLTNSGGLPATGAVIRQRLAREDGGETLQTQQQTLDLEAGSSQSLSRTYGTADLSAGGYVCALDLQEGESWKSLAQAHFAVTAVPARIEGQTSVQLAQLERGATQTCTDVLRNTGDLTATDALVRQTLASSAGTLIRSQEQSVTIAGGATQSLTREFATTDLTAGDYACAVEVQDGETWRSLSRAVFTVLPVPATIVGSVAAGAAEVEFGSSQGCTDIVNNTGDVSAAGIVLRRTLVSDASGEALVTASDTIDLDGGASRTLTRTLALDGMAAGSYACVLEMQEGEGWRFLGRAAFTIKPAPAHVEGTTEAALSEVIRGTSQSCTDQLSNTGGLPAENAVIRQALARGDGEVLQTQSQTLTLAAGGAQTLNRTYATSDLTAGAYACTLEVQEGDAWRQLSLASFEVKPVPAQVSGVTQVAQSQLERGGVQVCTDTLSNSGDVAAENKLIRRTLSSADGGTAIENLEQSLTLAGGASQSLSRDIDTTNLVAGDYACAVEIREGETWKALGRAAFTVNPVPAKVVGSVAAASAEVDYASTQTCTDTLDNTGDLTASGIVIRRSLVDASGTSVRSDEQTLDIASRTPQTLTRTLDLAGLSAGTYSCVLEQQVGSSWTELGRAGFAIKPAPAKVEGSVSVAQAEVQRGTAQTCTDVLTNSGGLPATGAVIRQRLTREEGGETLQTQQQTLDLEAGASQSLTRTYGTADLSAGGYVCALDLQEGESWKPLAQARFTVTAVPARIEGQTSVQLAQLERGTTQTCTDTVRNVGDVTATGVTVRQSILQSATGMLLQTREQVLDVPHDPEQQLIRVFSTQDLVPGEYACQLDVREDQAWKRLGQAPFVVQEPAIRVQANLGVGSRGRVLVLTDEPLSEQDIEERMFLDNLLESTGWSFTVDTNALAFTEDLRSGEYSLYALLNGKEKLAESAQKELREANFRGEGLIEAGSHDQRNNNVDDALGIKSTGKHSSATGVQMAATPLHGGGYSPLHRPQHNLRAFLGTGQSAGNYVGTGTPTTAVTTNNFGLGKSVYTGFDLLLEGEYQGPTGFFADLFGKSLDYVSPPLQSLATSGVVPLRLRLVNQGAAAQLRVLLPLPANVEVVDRGAAQVDASGTLVWTLSLAAGQERTLEAWVHLPNSPTTLHFDADVQAQRNGSYLTLAHATFDAQVIDKPDLDEARTLAGAKPAFKQVLNWLDKADRSIALADYARALKELTMASDEAAKVTDPAIRDLRVAIGEAIRDVGKRL